MCVCVCVQHTSTLSGDTVRLSTCVTKKLHSKSMIGEIYLTLELNLDVINCNQNQFNYHGMHRDESINNKVHK